MRMQYAEAPDYKLLVYNRILFLAGGITSCPDWQGKVTEDLSELAITVLNPRRADFDITQIGETKRQIRWEHFHLKEATAILFWFPAEAICPIALFELGRWLPTEKPLFVGTHPDYPRRLDVVEQSMLERPTEIVYNDLDTLVEKIRKWGQS